MVDRLMDKLGQTEISTVNKPRKQKVNKKKNNGYFKKFSLKQGVPKKSPPLNLEITLLLLNVHYYSIPLGI